MSNGRVKGRLITEWRKRKRLSVEALASDVGVSSSLMRAIEKDYMPRDRADEIMASLSSIMGVSVTALITPPAKETA